MWKSCHHLIIFSSIVLLTQLPSCLPSPSPQSGPLPFPSRIMSTPCTRNQQCSSKFNDTDCRNGAFCQCFKGFLEDFDKCLPIILDLITECQLNAQCALGTLGNLSRCNEETHRCECYDTAGNGKNSTAHGSHTCYYRKALGDHCDLNEECQASIVPAEDVKCDVRSRTCHCGDGKTCENVLGGSGSLESVVALVLLAVGAVKIAN